EAGGRGIRLGSGTGCYGIFHRGRADHSALMLAARITFAHFSVSSAMNLPKSAGVIDFGTLPMPANCVINLGSARAASIASWSLSMIAAGATNSPMGGAFGNAGERCGVGTARGGNLPALTVSAAAG